MKLKLPLCPLLRILYSNSYQSLDYLSSFLYFLARLLLDTITSPFLTATFLAFLLFHFGGIWKVAAMPNIFTSRR